MVLVLATTSVLMARTTSAQRLTTKVCEDLGGWEISLELCDISGLDIDTTPVQMDTRAGGQDPRVLTRPTDRPGTMSPQMKAKSGLCEMVPVCRKDRAGKDVCDQVCK